MGACHARVTVCPLRGPAPSIVEHSGRESSAVSGPDKRNSPLDTHQGRHQRRSGVETAFPGSEVKYIGAHRRTRRM